MRVGFVVQKLLKLELYTATFCEICVSPGNLVIVTTFCNSHD